MTHTRPDDFTVEDPDRAVPYTLLRGRMAHMEGPDPSYKWAGGGILSTPSDLASLGSAFLAWRDSDPEGWAELFTSIPLADGSANPQAYALGWRHGVASELVSSSDTVEVLHHGGASPGGSSFLLVIPDGGVAVAVMTNLSLGNPTELRRTAYQVAGLFRPGG